MTCGAGVQAATGRAPCGAGPTCGCEPAQSMPCPNLLTRQRAPEPCVPVQTVQSVCSGASGGSSASAATPPSAPSPGSFPPHHLLPPHAAASAAAASALPLPAGLPVHWAREFFLAAAALSGQQNQEALSRLQGLAQVGGWVGGWVGGRWMGRGRGDGGPELETNPRGRVFR